MTLLSFAGLSFLGLGVQAPDFDWGRLLHEGVARIYMNPMAAMGPGIAMVLTVLILNTAGSLFGEKALKCVRAAGCRGADRCVG